MGPFQVVDDYPGHAAKGADYFSSAPKGDVIETNADGKVVRPERVVITGVDILGEGLLCFGERTARTMGHLFGMVDGWRVQALMAATQAIVDERDLLSRELADARQQVSNLLETHRDAPAEVYVALDGTRHASADAAENATRTAQDLAAKALVGMRPIAAEEVAP